MLSASAKYYQSFLIGLQSNLVYRLNFAVRGFFSLFHLAVVFILWGAAYAGTAIELSMLGAAHAAANPLTAHFNIVHGAAVGLMLPAVIRFNATLPEAAAIYADLAVAAGIAGPHVPQSVALAWLIEAVTESLRTAGIPTTLTAAGVDPSAISNLAAEAARQWTATFNPRSITAADFEALYRETCG